EDPRFSSNTARIAHREATDSTVQDVIAALTTDEAERRLVDADVPFARLNEVSDVVRHPQAAATGRWSPVLLPDGRPATVVTSPFHREAEKAPGRRVPALGEGDADGL